ncbi:PDDEXK nuclease domain-containing protein [Christensenellaceae bacterium OttesenSCG-928-M15]|nr:PDDEXK nuclease domain-containing protein [Christensenellaceae bacterium OttesenSCG-928-M15]
MHLSNHDEYKRLLNDIKQQIQSSQFRAISAVNRELILLYWNIGKLILENQQNEGWGSKFIDNLAADIKLDFPEITGFSVRNLKYMRKFALEYSDIEFVQTVSAQITWSHNILLLDKIAGHEARKWYMEKSVENGWSLNVLRHQIETNLFERQAIAEKTTNFNSMLPSPQSELAEETLKDPYIFDFITLSENLKEADLERELTAKIARFLLELGAGFAFLGNQYHLTVGGEDFYIDMLFYNTKLRCYFVIELKTGKFKPEYAGKLNFYLSAVDDILKSKEDNPSIGILLCKEKNKIVTEYALRDMTKPIGVSEYKVFSELPEDLRNALPAIERLEELE